MSFHPQQPNDPKFAPHHKPTPHQPQPARTAPFAHAVNELLASLRPQTEIVGHGSRPSATEPFCDYREQADGAPYEDAA
jgi:hypothetical protein